MTTHFLWRKEAAAALASVWLIRRQVRLCRLSLRQGGLARHTAREPTWLFMVVFAHEVDSGVRAVL